VGAGYDGGPRPGVPSVRQGLGATNEPAFPVHAYVPMSFAPGGGLPVSTGVTRRSRFAGLPPDGQGGATMKLSHKPHAVLCASTFREETQEVGVLTPTTRRSGSIMAGVCRRGIYDKHEDGGGGRSSSARRADIILRFSADVLRTI